MAADSEDIFYKTLCSSETLRSGSKGFFHEFSESVINEAGEVWIGKIFGRLNSDVDRVRTVLTDPRVKNIVSETLDRVKHLYRDKDAAISGRKRLEGLEIAARGNHEKALLLFSQAVLRAPATGKFPAVDQGFSLPLGLLARGETLMALGDYDFALEDLKLAAEEDLPQKARTLVTAHPPKVCTLEWTPRVALRATRSSEIRDLATVIFTRDQLTGKIGECIRLLDESGKSLTTYGGQASAANQWKKQFQTPISPQLSGGPSSRRELSGASRLVDIQETEEAGKHAVAADEILPGDVLASEPPLASCLLPEFYGTHCQHCLRRLRAPVGCPVCSSVAFCGRRCRDQALATYHKYECKILALLVGSGMSVLSTLALRMVTQEGYENCRRIYDTLMEQRSRPAETKAARIHEKKNLHAVQTENNAEAEVSLSKGAKRRLRKKKLKDNSVYHNDGRKENAFRDENAIKVDVRAYDLVTLAGKRTGKDYLERTLMALFLLKGLQKVWFFDKTSTANETTEEEIMIGALLLRNLQLLQFNAHEIYETRLAPNHRFRGNKTVYVGVGIYPSVARFNHGCYPAVTRYFAGRDIVVRALRPLKVGDVVAENYGPIFTKRSLKERQRSLMGRYWFRCACLACVEDWPSFDNLTNHSTRLRCTTDGCKGSLAHPRKPGQLVKCSTCQKVKNLEERLKHLAECESEYARALACMEEEKTAQAIEIFSKALKKFHQVAVPPHRETHLAEIALAGCLADSGNTWRPLQ